ncbi:peroxisomal membrane protein PEX16 [Bacillus rossius redtenbacheri]|uniref:peroxisomal membrane protein PEX16 n=1 Tax=Bacillus rossius redtenbacheri TaxID=93214 RepID=UPI002FDCD85F
MSTNLKVLIQDLFRSYRNWVCVNPKQASDVEAFAKYVSYFIAGRINDSTIPSELVYSLSNLLVFFNDRMIQKARREAPGSVDRLKTWLTVVEYVEVFVEITTRRLFGEKGRWIVIVCLQLLKCVGRLALVFQHGELVTQTPAIPPLMRDGAPDVSELDEKLQVQSAAFTLRRSGRVIRRVEMAPPIRSRAWKPLRLPAACRESKTVMDEETSFRSIAECLYIIKPIAHLCLMSVHGQKSWKPWLMSLVMDIVSLHTHRKRTRSSLSRRQQLELSRRLVALVLYALRSPFYEAHTEQRLVRALNCLGRSVPLVGALVGPLAHYLPLWQDTYFYIWST